MTRAFPVSGLQDLNRYLSVLPKNMQRNAYSSGLRAAAAVIREEAREQAKGRIAGAVVSGSARQNQDGTLSIRVYVDERKPDGFLGYFMEYGVLPHLIARTGKGEGRIAVRKSQEGRGTIDGGVMKIGDKFVSGIISHPGHAAHPFMRPALDTKGEAAVQAFATRIRAYLEGKTGFAAPVEDAA